MNKSDIVAIVAEEARITTNEARRAVDAMLEAITTALERAEKVTIQDFAVMHVIEKPAREGINPRTKERIIIPSRRTVHFKEGMALHERINIGEW